MNKVVFVVLFDIVVKCFFVVNGSGVGVGYDYCFGFVIQLVGDVFGEVFNDKLYFLGYIGGM